MKGRVLKTSIISFVDRIIKSMGTHHYWIQSNKSVKYLADLRRHAKEITLTAKG